MNKLPIELSGMPIASGIFVIILRILVDKKIITEDESVKYWAEYQPTFFPNSTDVNPYKSDLIKLKKPRDD